MPKTKDEIMHDLLKADMLEVLKKKEKGYYAAAAEKIYEKQSIPLKKRVLANVAPETKRLVILISAEVAICLVALLAVMYGSSGVAAAAYNVSFVQGLFYLLLSTLIFFDRKDNRGDTSAMGIVSAVANGSLYIFFRSVLAWQFLLPEMPYKESVLSPCDSGFMVQADVFFIQIGGPILLFFWCVLICCSVVALVSFAASKFFSNAH